MFDQNTYLLSNLLLLCGFGFVLFFPFFFNLIFFILLIITDRIIALGIMMYRLVCKCSYLGLCFVCVCRCVCVFLFDDDV